MRKLAIGVVERTGVDSTLARKAFFCCELFGCRCFHSNSIFHWLTTFEFDPKTTESVSVTRKVSMNISTAAARFRKRFSFHFQESTLGYAGCCRSFADSRNPFFSQRVGFEMQLPRMGTPQGDHEFRNGSEPAFGNKNGRC